ncbi:MAG: DUF1049 domain-containing protein [Gammaproteobacteria bacterium]|nr:MAG: DUF1049 domain-containing protein [Gammaproteobacteria bacterium]
MTIVARFLLLLAVLAVFLLGLLFHARNGHPVTLDYYLGTVELPLSLFSVLLLLSGALLGILATLLMVLRLRRENRRLRRRLEESAKEVENLRALPIKDAP